MFVDLAREVFRQNRGRITPAQAVDIVLTRRTPEQIALYVQALWLRGPERVMELLRGDAEGIEEEAELPRLRGGDHRRHIIYAYMLESTNMLAVFERVLQEWLHGERLSFATAATQTWLRTTEQLFFTTPQPPSIASLMSDIRPDRGA